MRSLVLALVALLSVGCAEYGEFPNAEAPTCPAAPAPVPTTSLHECSGSVELQSTAPVCLIARDENGPCFWRCR